MGTELEDPCEVVAAVVEEIDIALLLEVGVALLPKVVEVGKTV